MIISRGMIADRRLQSKPVDGLLAFIHRQGGDISKRGPLSLPAQTADVVCKVVVQMRLICLAVSGSCEVDAVEKSLFEDAQLQCHG
jgi:hypothetical protein